MVNSVSQTRFAQNGRAKGRRARERGATMFVVMMVLMILSALGTFAVSNAHFDVQSAGYDRQRNAAIELSGFGAYAVAQEVATSPRDYLKMVLTGSEACKANLGLAMTPAPCYHVYPKDVENRLGMTSEKLIVPAIPASGTPGTFGITSTGGGFVAEITDAYKVTRLVPGFQDDTNAPVGVDFVDFAVTSTGVVFRDDNLNGTVDWSLGEGLNALFVTGRGHVVVGPITK